MKSPKLVLIGSLGVLASAAKSSLSPRGNACAALAASLPGDVSYPNTTAYIQSSYYWSDQQRETHPQCFVTPRTTSAVSSVIQILTRHNAPFTVKSGGHSPFAGGSSIANGVTIDLVHLNTIEVSADCKTVSLGPGNRWINVTEILDPLGLAVVGGRDMNVGVSGFILGGGISFFSGMKGWACDNVRGFEIVLASGNVVYASPTENADLYWALRGGGGLNFGIVTRFDLAAFEQGTMWVNSLTFPGTENATIISLFQNLTIQGMPQDPAAHALLTFSSSPSGENRAIVNLFHATVPSPQNSVPAVFEPFQTLPSALANTSSVGDVSKYLKHYATPYGGRWTWGNVILAANFSQTVLDEILAHWEERNAALINSGVADTSVLVQAIPVNVIEEMQKNGGNALGFKPSGGPLVLVSFPTSWTDPRNDKLVEDSTRKLIADVETTAKKYGVLNPFVYLNYADSNQPVQRSYGDENYDRLKQIARKYDPQSKLAQLWTGYFKL
ncbi:FAD-binding domain-containing protein [Lentithecium fluviatile CBS 122367]|uniref:FAD-binding domain-containing protein n=1 Tax=Lentithecium fluviatile CBS 122367 TaxID=1168545 RepID=A0A6G1J3B2_9PLEO|nr:FAD-binding domain-containing protein [Lentithecium fluviatile CBS 122367]